MSATRHRSSYGLDPLQFGDLRLPAGIELPPVAMVIHGGFWRNKYGLDYLDTFCEAISAAGIATWNIEYRRIGDAGGGWPGTFDDVSAAADHLQSLAGEFPLDLDRVAAVGHSAGGHLAFWLSSEKKWIRAAVSLAGVLDLWCAWDMQLSNSVVTKFLGGSPEDVPERYFRASPMERLPMGKPQRLFHGTADTSVPYLISERYLQAARDVGDDAKLITFEGSGHFELVNPATDEFDSVRNEIVKLLASPHWFF